MAQILLTTNPKKRRKSRRKASARKVRLVKRAAPRRRRKARSVTRIVTRRSNPHRRVRLVRKRRSNPSFGGVVSGVVPTLKAGFKGALGAIGVDLAWGYGAAYLPATLQTGIPMYATKLVAALAVGALANKVKPGSGRDLAVGGTTVVLHDAIREQLREFLPADIAARLGAYTSFAPVVGVSSPAVRAIPRTMSGVGGLGMYVRQPNLAGLGDGAGGGSSYNYEDGIR